MRVRPEQQNDIMNKVQRANIEIRQDIRESLLKGLSMGGNTAQLHDLFHYVARLQSRFSFGIVPLPSRPTSPKYLEKST